MHCFLASSYDLVLLGISSSNLDKTLASSKAYG